ncbi:hypothetical protein KFL_012560010 [Klebsormidium nitens]|uniref:Uncharacterized protein n=1 Tax=Klebsormidium nitens TaxID=105231 RepID=A0A1Y1IQS2_KLENI|nr:hypothetical protein KFL_012560010 [Klebsormidium nitens]|eukprot:GAQ93023.1 hypothetical protein KFL_012560010 [Klebsormidium nitens]
MALSQVSRLGASFKPFHPVKMEAKPDPGKVRVFRAQASVKSQNDELEENIYRAKVKADATGPENDDAGTEAESKSWKKIFEENDKLCRAHQAAFRRSGGSVLKILYLDTLAVEALLA